MLNGESNGFFTRASLMQIMASKYPSDGFCGNVSSEGSREGLINFLWY